MNPQRPQRKLHAVLQQNIMNGAAYGKQRGVARAFFIATVEPHRQQPKTVLRFRVVKVAIPEPRQQHAPRFFRGESFAGSYGPQDIPRGAVVGGIGHAHPERPGRRLQRGAIRMRRLLPEGPGSAKARRVIAIHQPRHQRAEVGGHHPWRGFLRRGHQRGPQATGGGRQRDAQPNANDFPRCGKIRAAAPGFFHTMEKLCAIFPHNGTTLGPLFHTVEKWGGFFPHRGKMGRIFSTLWKKVFHTVEKVAGGPGAPWKKGPHISRRPFPAGPQKRPLRTMMAPRTVTTSGAPCTAKPS